MIGEAMIKAEQVVKKYGSRRALDGLTLSIPAHSVTAVLGPNGAGKSTFFRMIAGMVKPDSGSFTVMDREPGWQLNASIGYLPDRARWYTHHTVAKAIDWAANMHPGFNRTLAEGLMAEMGLDAQMPVRGMSRGQEARLMLGICMSREVPLIVLDEPFSGIDIISREKIIGVLIDALAERRQTILISTHEIMESESLFDYAVFLDGGRAVLAGEVEQMRAERGSVEDVYRNLYR